MEQLSWRAFSPTSSKGLLGSQAVVKTNMLSNLHDSGSKQGDQCAPSCPCRRSGMTWMTKEGVKAPNYWGSLTQASTLRIGNFEGEEVHVPFKSLLPMVEPNDIVLGGWDISGLNMVESMERAKVIDFNLQQQLVPYMKDIVPLPGEKDLRPDAVGCGVAAALAIQLDAAFLALPVGGDAEDYAFLYLYPLPCSILLHRPA